MAQLRHGLRLGLGLFVVAACAGCQPPAEPTATTPPKLEAPIEAKAGVGKQGQSLRDETGLGRMIATPAVALFNTKQKVVLEIQVPQALQLFEATEGRKPKNHDEFMTKIIKANNLVLPELPAGQEYKYHPEDGQLWVHPVGE